MAEKLEMDPVKFRIANDTQPLPANPSKPGSDEESKKDEEKPASHPPFSKWQLVECLREGGKALRLGKTQSGQWGGTIQHRASMQPA